MAIVYILEYSTFRRKIDLALGRDSQYSEVPARLDDISLNEYRTSWCERLMIGLTLRGYLSLFEWSAHGIEKYPYMTLFG